MPLCPLKLAHLKADLCKKQQEVSKDISVKKIETNSEVKALSFSDVNLLVLMEKYFVAAVEDD